MVRVVAIYPNREGSRFDAAYYRDSHAPLAQRLQIPHGLLGLRLSEGLAALDGTPPAFWMLSEMRFASRDGFDAAMAEWGAALFADTPNYTDVEPVLQLCAAPVELAYGAATESDHHA